VRLALLQPRRAALHSTLALAALASAASAQAQDVGPDSKRWWQDIGTSVLMPLGDWDVYLKDGLRVDNPSLNTRLKLNARVFGDGGHVGLNDELQAVFPQPDGWDSAITQARLTLLGWVFDTGKFKLQLEFADGFQVKDSWFQFNPLPYVGLITLGNMKEPFSLDELISSGNRTFMTEALPVLAFAPGRNIGVMANNTAFDEHLTWAIGGFWNTGSYSSFADAKDAFDNANGFHVTGRVTYLPTHDDGGRELTHLGLSVSLQSFTDEAASRAVPETTLINDYFADTGLFQPDRATSVSIEFAKVQGPWSIQSELMWNRYQASALGNPVLTGFYIFGSHILTGEHRLYDPSEGVFYGVIPKQNFSLANGTWGAVEVALRLSALNLDSQALSGGRQRDVTLGLNWYLNPSTRLMLNYVHALVNGRANPPVVDGGRANIFQTRLQVEF
jgi:phosphate-selective porin OprO/OprP